MSTSGRTLDETPFRPDLRFTPKATSTHRDPISSQARHVTQRHSRFGTMLGQEEGEIAPNTLVGGPINLENGQHQEEEMIFDEQNKYGDNQGTDEEGTYAHYVGSEQREQWIKDAKALTWKRRQELIQLDRKLFGN